MPEAFDQVTNATGCFGFLAANLIKQIPEGFDLVTNAASRYGFLAADLTPVPEGIDQVIMPQAAMAS